jgi:hypothetical protein
MKPSLALLWFAFRSATYSRREKATAERCGVGPVGRPHPPALFQLVVSFSCLFCVPLCRRIRIHNTCVLFIYTYEREKVKLNWRDLIKLLFKCMCVFFFLFFFFFNEKVSIITSDLSSLL